MAYSNKTAIFHTRKKEIKEIEVAVKRGVTLVAEEVENILCEGPITNFSGYRFSYKNIRPGSKPARA